MKVLICYLLLAPFSFVENRKHKDALANLENVRKEKEISLCDTYLKPDDTVPLRCFCSPHGDEADCILSNNSKVDQNKWHLLTTIQNITRLIVQITTRDYQAIPNTYLNEFPHLRHITFKFNYVRILPSDAFSNLDYITHLRIAGNKFPTISPRAISNLGSLIHLQFEYNIISSLSKDMFYNLPFLRTLDLRGNNITGLSKSQFESIPSLRVLILTNNRLKQVSELIFSGLKKLHHLDLSLNKLKKIKNNTFRRILNLKSLNISANEIENLEPAAFRGMHKLDSLSLHQNHLVKFHDATFNSLSHLTKLDLRNNRLVNLPFSAIEPFYKNYFRNDNGRTDLKLHLSGNDLKCECSLAWMYPLAKNLREVGRSYAFNAEDTVCYFKVSCTDEFNCPVPFEKSRLHTKYSDEYYINLTKIQISPPNPPQNNFHFEITYVDLIEIPIEALNCQNDAAKITLGILCFIKVLLLLLITRT